MLCEKYRIPFLAHHVSTFVGIISSKKEVIVQSLCIFLIVNLCALFALLLFFRCVRFIYWPDSNHKCTDIRILCVLCPGSSLDRVVRKVCYALYFRPLLLINLSWKIKVCHKSGNEVNSERNFVVCYFDCHKNHTWKMPNSVLGRMTIFFRHIFSEIVISCFHKCLVDLRMMHFIAFSAVPVMLVLGINSLAIRFSIRSVFLDPTDQERLLRKARHFHRSFLCWKW